MFSGPNQAQNPFRRLLEEVPSISSFTRRDSAANEWLARGMALSKQLSLADNTRFQFAVRNLRSIHPGLARRQLADIETLLAEFAVEVDNKQGRTCDRIIEAGKPFDYYEALSAITATALADLFFIDPYADASFLTTYVRPLDPKVRVRILCDKYCEDLVIAARLLGNQTGQSIEVRKRSNMHDRFIILDRSKCFTSGASFKDGGRKSPTHISEIRDVAQLLADQYEELWATANP